MARLPSTDATDFFELTPTHLTRGRGETGDDDEVICDVKFEAWGEPIGGTASLTRGGLERMIGKLKGFCEKRAGMMQLRSDTQDLELTLAAKRSKWTQNLNVTGLAGIPKDESEPIGPSLRVSFGAALRAPNAQGGAVEHRTGMYCTFDELERFARAIQQEFESAPSKRGTGELQPPRS